MVVHQGRSQRRGKSCSQLYIKPLSASITLSADFVNSLLGNTNALKGMVNSNRLLCESVVLALAWQEGIGLTVMYLTWVRYKRMGRSSRYFSCRGEDPHPEMFGTGQEASEGCAGI